MKPCSQRGLVPAPIAYVAAIVLAACSSGSSPAPEVYGTATIGPAGGELVVVSGPQAGLRLSVPAGALAAPTELRVVALPPSPPFASPVIAPDQPGVAFDLQPAGLELDEQASLRVPYRVADTPAGTSPYNVLVRRVQGTSSYELAPTTNDPATRLVEVPIRTLGRYQVVRGPAASGIAAYRQPVGTTVALGGGWSFAVEEVPPGTPFGGDAPQRWRIRAPALGVDDVLYFDGDLLRGRESAQGAEDWREVWNQPCAAWTFAGGSALPPPSLTTGMGVETPIGALPMGGTMTVWGFTSFTAPRTVAGRLFCDAIQLTITLAWQRADIGTGQRQYTFLFAPGAGLLGFTQDAVVHERTTI